MSWLIINTLILICACSIKCQINLSYDACSSKLDCRSCIQTKSCAWCSDNERYHTPFCFSPNEESRAKKCKEDDIYYPENTLEAELQNSTRSPVIPQKYHMNLKINEPFSVTLLINLRNTSIELKDNASGHIKVKYYSNCLDASKPEFATNKCDNLTSSQEVPFRLEFELEHCAQDPTKWTQTVKIRYAENVCAVFNIKSICSCPCEEPGSPYYEETSKFCNYFGTYQCGICECDNLHSGRRCECPAASFSDLNCTSPITNDECSGKGICICNKCECDIPDNPDERIRGNWCECDNSACKRIGGKICNGHGKCDCGYCICEDPWTGEGCECKNTTASCIIPYNNNSQICNGHGECICGSCVCTEEHYVGRYCDRVLLKKLFCNFAKTKP